MQGYARLRPSLPWEVALDELARKLKMDPFTIRRINGLAHRIRGGYRDVIIPGGPAYLENTGRRGKKYYEGSSSRSAEQDPAIGIGVASGWRHILGRVGPAEETRVGLELLDDGRVQMKACCAQMGNETLVGWPKSPPSVWGCGMRTSIFSSDLQTDLTPVEPLYMAYYSRGLILWGRHWRPPLKPRPQSHRGGKTTHLGQCRVPGREDRMQGMGWTLMA